MALFDEELAVAVRRSPMGLPGATNVSRASIGVLFLVAVFIGFILATGGQF